MSVALLSDFMAGLGHKGFNFLSRTREETKRDIASLCDSLVSGRGEISCFVIAEAIFQRWEMLDAGQRRACLGSLSKRFAPDAEAIQRHIKAIEKYPSPENFYQLHAISEPRAQELIRRLNHARNGTRRLVQMREVLLDALTTDRSLEGLDRDFVHLFTSWFNRGFLQLKPINWDTPASILEKVIRYEAVHAITDWDDLRRRIEPEDRRLFAFFHPQMHDEPLIFVEVALTTAIPGDIAGVLRPDRTIVPRDEATTAVFYSISNCQMGLRGISFGNVLIKQVVEELRRDLPSLRAFVTLSPAPDFARWLTHLRTDSGQSILSASDIALLAKASVNGWERDTDLLKELNPLLRGLAVRYFTQAKNRQNRPFDSVARFHLGNGASLENIHAMADVSPKGLATSYGLMVNYLYKTGEIETNHENYAENGTIAISGRLKTLLKHVTSK
ncbi:malonyl-CoA decarboxylase [Mesorhizobium sp. LHD-90]|uniref:malonyl-CoA decarboxylase n=1 Tax=Mesorhizobium sp. LHD-90 TaxID=3071414 RepID=UPI0027E11550|nr:malonyl-CoA decarboxylase [Mesorhizobium sp. LHD-90]MDQ6432535.1 malonyl-CoA decarboxylase [Mesorhizobium sp. LHD-90]